MISEFDFSKEGFGGRSGKTDAVKHALQVRDDIKSEWQGGWAVERVRSIGPDGERLGWLVPTYQPYLQSDGTRQGYPNLDSVQFSFFNRAGEIVTIPVESFEADRRSQLRLFNPDDDDEDDRTVIEQMDWEDDDGDPGIDALPQRGEQMGLFGGVEFTSEALSPPGRLTILNMGLGRDSISMICLLAKNQLMVDGKFLGPDDVDAVVFSDTGAEWRHTMDLIPRVEEFSRKNGIRFIWLQKPVPGTETGRLLDDWLETQTRYRKEREQGWADVYQEKVVPLYAKKDREADELRAPKGQRGSRGREKTTRSWILQI